MSPLALLYTWKVYVLKIASDKSSNPICCLDFAQYVIFELKIVVNQDSEIFFFGYCAEVLTVKLIRASLIIVTFAHRHYLGLHLCAFSFNNHLSVHVEIVLISVWSLLVSKIYNQFSHLLSSVYSKSIVHYIDFIQSSAISKVEKRLQACSASITVSSVTTLNSRPIF